MALSQWFKYSGEPIKDVGSSPATGRQTIQVVVSRDQTIKAQITKLEDEND